MKNRRYLEKNILFKPGLPVVNHIYFYFCLMGICLYNTHIMWTWYMFFFLKVLLKHFLSAGLFDASESRRKTLNLWNFKQYKQFYLKIQLTIMYAEHIINNEIPWGWIFFEKNNLKVISKTSMNWIFIDLITAIHGDGYTILFNYKKKQHQAAVVSVKANFNKKNWENVEGVTTRRKGVTHLLFRQIFALNWSYFPNLPEQRKYLPEEQIFLSIYLKFFVFPQYFPHLP